jgi:hypothetical protein
MPVHNLHRKPFDEGTRGMLELYREYLCEWLPVFINVSSVDILQIFDIFCRACVRIWTNMFLCFKLRIG